MNLAYFKDYQKANSKVRNVIKALCDLVPATYELGYITFTINKCKENNRIVFEFNDYFLINIDSMIFYCLKSEIN